MPNKAHVLVVENDKSTCQGLVTQLRDAGYDASPANDAKSALEGIKNVCPDAIIMDVAISAISDVLTQLRGDSESATRAPVILLAARGSEGSAVAAMETGADDFLVKPTRASEVVARVQIALRRSAREEPARSVALRAGPIFLNTERHEVFARGSDGQHRPLKLTRREFALLRALMARKNQMMSRQQIVDEAFGDGAPIDPANLGAYIHRLREKVEPNPAEPRHIVTDRGLGFKIVD